MNKEFGPDLYFKNAVFELGDNVTVRNGRKWVAHIGKYVDIKEVGNGIKGKGLIKSAIVKPFALITDEDIEKEHDPKCRDKWGLFEVMKDVYPEFKQDNIVTILTFWFEEHYFY